MKISVELTLTPLKDDFRTSIKEFIKTLRGSNFIIKETPLSTQLSGDYDTLMKYLTSEIKVLFEQEMACMMHIKIVKGDRSDYVADF